VEEPLAGEEMSKLEEADPELNAADCEDNNDDGASLVTDWQEEQERELEEMEEEMGNGGGNPKEYRDIAEGKNLNNSFVGPYPENWDHLHIDKGRNPQFTAFSERKEVTVFDLAQKYGFIK
jgi:hypothetical protein